MHPATTADRIIVSLLFFRRIAATRLLTTGNLLPSCGIGTAGTSSMRLSGGMHLNALRRGNGGGEVTAKCCVPSRSCS